MLESFREMDGLHTVSSSEVTALAHEPIQERLSQHHL